MAKAMLKQKDMLDRAVDQIDLQGITRDGLFGPDGIIKQLSARLLNKALEAEMNLSPWATRSMIARARADSQTMATAAATAGTGIMRCIC